ncbi:MAG: tol-pal system protein YbgF [Sodalis sp. (in: enterobacteria)]
MNNNFRPYILSLSLSVGVAAPLAATAKAPINNANSSSLEDRVTQLERISDAHSQLLTYFQQQLTDQERGIDLLRGQIQENQYQLSQVIERQKEIYQQINSFSNQPKPTATPSGSDANSDYKEAVALVLEKKQYDQAISALQSFVKRYPDSTYQPNANYWLGQLNYNQGKKDNAAYYFALLVKNYPKSPKAPDALLKIGVIMQEKGQKNKARAVYQQVSKLYPSATAAKQAQKRLMSL